MDMRKYASKYIKPDKCAMARSRPASSTCSRASELAARCSSSKPARQFTLNDGNTNTLMKAWGYKADDWIGQELELVLGTYKDWKSDPPADKETVRVRAISPAKTPAQNGGAPAVSKPPSRASRPVRRAGVIPDDYGRRRFRSPGIGGWHANKL